MGEAVQGARARPRAPGGLRAGCRRRLRAAGRGAGACRSTLRMLTMRMTAPRRRLPGPSGSRRGRTCGAGAEKRPAGGDDQGQDAERRHRAGEPDEGRAGRDASKGRQRPARTSGPAAWTAVGSGAHRPAAPHRCAAPAVPAGGATNPLAPAPRRRGALARTARPSGPQDVADPRGGPAARRAAGQGRRHGARDVVHQGLLAPATAGRHAMTHPARPRPPPHAPRPQPQ
ncbi:hypothetical protein QFZ24_009777 [Streptomyces phaeochromogenes]|nr:hypothetical protein [Streptomyces phaeochromogenes]